MLSFLQHPTNRRPHEVLFFVQSIPAGTGGAQVSCQVAAPGRQQPRDHPTCSTHPHRSGHHVHHRYSKSRPFKEFSTAEVFYGNADRYRFRRLD
jgi:hypothetical protein